MIGTIPTTVVVTVTNCLNNWYVFSPSFTLKTATNDATIYLVEAGTASTTFTEATLTTTYTPSNLLTLLSTSTLNLRITTPFSVTTPNPSLLTFTLVPPN